MWGADENPQWGVNRINGSVAGAFVKLPPSVTQVEVAVAISYVSLAQAQRNLQVQVRTFKKPSRDNRGFINDG